MSTWVNDGSPFQYVRTYVSWNSPIFANERMVLGGETSAEGSTRRWPIILLLLLLVPRGSMYSIFTHMYHRNQRNVCKYTSPMDSMAYWSIVSFFFICSRLQFLSSSLFSPKKAHLSPDTSDDLGDLSGTIWNQFLANDCRAWNCVKVPSFQLSVPRNQSTHAVDASEIRRFLSCCG